MPDTTTTQLADAVNTLLDENADLGVLNNPSTFDIGKRGFTNTQAGGRPSSLPAANGAVVINDDVGVVLEMAGDSQGTAPSIYQRGYMPIIPGASYRSRVMIYQSVDAENIGSAVYHGFSIYDADKNYLEDVGFAQADAGLEESDGWVIFTASTDEATITAANADARYIKSRVRPNCDAAGDEGDGTVQLKFIELRDLGIPPSVSDEAYDATSWNGVTGVAPSKNAVRDQFSLFGTPGAYAPTLNGLADAAAFLSLLQGLSDPVMTRGANETVTGLKTHTQYTTYNVSNSLAIDLTAGGRIRLKDSGGTTRGYLSADDTLVSGETAGAVILRGDTAVTIAIGAEKEAEFRSGQADIFGARGIYIDKGAYDGGGRLQIPDNYGGAASLVFASETNTGIIRPAGSSLGIVVTGTERWRFTTAALRPAADNAYTLGDGSFRPSTLFAVSGTINTSDARDKTPLREIPENVKRAIAAIKSKIGVYQWLDAIEAKGEDGARLHVGVTAQVVRDAFLAEGEDPARWAVFCADPVFEDVPIETPVESEEPVYDEQDDFEIVVEGGKAIRKAVVRRSPRTKLVPVVDEGGAQVMEDGTPLMANVPETETIVTMVPSLERRAVMDPETGEQKVRLGVRYDQLLVLMAAT